MASARGRASRLAWFAGLYFVSLGVFAAIVYGLRGLIGR